VAGLLEGMSRAFTLGRWEPPFTRYTVAEMGFGVTLNIDAARADLGYRPAADVIQRLRETGAAWRAARTPIQGARS
jgi:nucleoside-diphosphate-sugar epimerase